MLKIGAENEGNLLFIFQDNSISRLAFSEGLDSFVTFLHGVFLDPRLHIMCGSKLKHVFDHSGGANHGTNKIDLLDSQ